MVPVFAVTPLEETIVSVWNLTWNMTVRSISIRLQAALLAWHGEPNSTEWMETRECRFNVCFLSSISKLNASKDMLHKHVSNTPVITNITLNSSFSIPLWLLSFAHCCVSLPSSAIRLKRVPIEWVAIWVLCIFLPILPEFWQQFYRFFFFFFFVPSLSPNWCILFWSERSIDTEHVSRSLELWNRLTSPIEAMFWFQITINWKRYLKISWLSLCTHLLRRPIYWVNYLVCNKFVIMVGKMS